MTKTKTVLIFGAGGGIGKATYNLFEISGYQVTGIAGRAVDFSDPDSYLAVEEILLRINPDIIVNCVGHFDKQNIETHRDTFDINIGSNWSIIRYYMNKVSQKPIKIIMVGSSAYKSGRKAYILYAASKAALYNVWQGACDYFQDSNVTLGLVNPVRTRTPMIDMTTSAVCLEPEDVAEEILSISSTKTNQLVDMKYPEEN
jgi:short-subunit dehydrogenase